MWVVPFVSGGRRVTAVNIASARHLELGKAEFGKEGEWLAVYAVFSESEHENRRIPLVEIAVTDPHATDEVTRFYIHSILEALENNVQMFRFDSYLRFVPSRVEGLPDVTEVVMHPKWMQLRSRGQWVSFVYADIAAWPRPALFWRQMVRFGWKPKWLPVADRDWFHPPSERFFRFFTQPPITVYLPDEPLDVDYRNTHFRRVQDVLLKGGFSTYDLG